MPERKHDLQRRVCIRLHVAEDARSVYLSVCLPQYHMPAGAGARSHNLHLRMSEPTDLHVPEGAQPQHLSMRVSGIDLHGTQGAGCQLPVHLSQHVCAAEGAGRRVSVRLSRDHVPARAGDEPHDLCVRVPESAGLYRAAGAQFHDLSLRVPESADLHGTQGARSHYLHLPVPIDDLSHRADARPGDVSMRHNRLPGRDHSLPGHRPVRA